MPKRRYGSGWPTGWSWPMSCSPLPGEQGLTLATKPPRALQKSKALLKQELKQAVHFVIDLEARAFAQALQGEEAQQRIAHKLKRRS